MWPGEVEILGVGFLKKIPGFNGLKHLQRLVQEHSDPIFGPTPDIFVLAWP